MTEDIKGTMLPSPKELLLSTPLYEEFPLAENDSIGVAELEVFEGPVDAYCIECGQNTVFRRNLGDNYRHSGSPPAIGYLKSLTNMNINPIADKFILINLKCSRDQNHDIVFHFLIRKQTLIKIGQYPSLADFDSQDIKQYRSVLDKQNFADFRRAIGLHAHGVGIGAFIYLRRILEKLIEEARAKARSEPNWDEETYNRSRMVEKIEQLQDHLPSLLIEMKSIYSIMSKGVHSLSEEECLEYFKPLRIGIELILEQKLEQLREAQKLQKIAEAKQAISSITSKLS